MTKSALQRGAIGILHGAETYVLQDGEGQIADTWSLSAGLDYPAVGPEHAHLKDSGRAQYVGASDDDFRQGQPRRVTPPGS